MVGKIIIYFCNICAPNTVSSNFFTSFTQLVSAKEYPNLVIAGDFIVILNTSIDCSSTSFPSAELYEGLQYFLANVTLVEV